MCVALAATVGQYVYMPVELSAPRLLETDLDLRLEVISRLLLILVQHQHATEVLNVLHTPQLRDACALHLRGGGGRGGRGGE